MTAFLSYVLVSAALFFSLFLGLSSNRKYRYWNATNEFGPLRSSAHSSSLRLLGSPVPLKNQRNFLFFCVYVF